jgi:biofilm PGA synthesis protein PgaD
VKDLIIDKPSLQPLRQRYATGIVTFLFWIVWAYIWLPVISLIAWALGIKFFYDEMIARGGYEAFLELLIFYLIVIFLIAVIFIGWATYNFFRFRGMERRRAIKPLETEDYARYFSVNGTELKNWRNMKRITIHFDEQGNILRVEEL